jgi:hypothetical protein
MSIYAELCKRYTESVLDHRDLHEKAKDLASWIVAGLQQHLGCSSEVCSLARVTEMGALNLAGPDTAVVYNKDTDAFDTKVVVILSGAHLPNFPMVWNVSLFHTEGAEFEVTVNKRKFMLGASDILIPQRTELCELMVQDVRTGMDR